MSRASARTAYSAFISHAKADEKKAREIAAALEERGFKCWIAPRNVRPGHSYGDEIVRGIEKSRTFILVLSKASNGSAFVAREVERAVSKDKAVYAIRLENVQPSPSLELFISGTQWIDAWSGRLAHHTDSLANLLRKKKDAAQTATASELEAKPPMLRRLRSPWLLGGAAVTIAAIAAAVLVLKPFGPGGPGSDSPASLVDDPDYQACAKMSGDTAITFCDRAIASGNFSGKELATTYLNRGYEREAGNDRDGALSDYAAAISAYPAYALAYYNRGSIYRHLGKLDLALKDLNEAIRLDTKDPKAYNRRGLIFKEEGDFDSALKDYNAALALDSTHVTTLSNRGDLYRLTGKVDLAMADYKKVLSLNPDDATKQATVVELSALGVSTADKTADPHYQGCEKLSGAAAIAACDRAIASGTFGGKELAELYRLRGWERREKNDADGAMSDYNQALQIDPANTTAYYNRGNVYYVRNELDLAIKDFDEAIRLYPDYANAFWGRGKAYKAKGDIEQAKEDYNKALSLNPQDAIKQEIEAALKMLDEQSGAATESGNAAANAAAASDRAATPPVTSTGSSASQQ